MAEATGLPAAAGGVTQNSFKPPGATVPHCASAVQLAATEAQKPSTPHTWPLNSAPLTSPLGEQSRSALQA